MQKILQLRYIYVARLTLILDAQSGSQACSLSGDPANRNEPGYIRNFEFGGDASSGREHIFDLRGNEGAVGNLEFGRVCIGAGIANHILKFGAAVNFLSREFFDSVKEPAEPHTQLRGCFGQIDFLVSGLLAELLDIAPSPLAMLKFQSGEVRDVQSVANRTSHIEPVHMRRGRGIPSVTIEIADPTLGGAAAGGLAYHGMLRVFGTSSRGHIDLVDVPDSTDETDVRLNFFKSRARGRVNITVPRTIDHDVGEDCLSPRLAFENGAAHGSLGIYNGVDAPAIQVSGDSGIEHHVGQ